MAEEGMNHLRKGKQQRYLCELKTNALLDKYLGD